MKRLFSIVAMLLVLVCVFASCSTIKSIIIKHDVTFDLNGGAAGENFNESVVIGDGKTLTLSTPTREGYVFLGWYSGDTEITEETPVTEDLTLVAKWELASYVITYNLGELGESFTANCPLGELPAVPEIPVVENHVFFGWYTDEELTDRYFFDYLIDENITLYAKFYDTSLGEYIVLSNVDQLKAISEQPDAKYLLACDINCKGETLTPIDEFTGELDGNGYKIHNFAINEDALNVGFIRVNKGTIMNLSFGDFIYDVLISGGGDKYYGIICGNNEGGLIYNCTSFDGEIKVDADAIACAYNLYLGGLVGLNNGTVKKCANYSTISARYDVDGYWGANGYLYTHTGGICGQVSKDSKTIDCINDAYIEVTTCPGSGYGGDSAYYGGVVGTVDHGIVEQCANTGDLKAITIDYNWICLYMGGAVGNNIGGSVENSYVNCDITIENTGTNGYYNLIGGFVGYNSGKVYNCYSVVNIKDNTPTVKSIGGFAGLNELLSGYEAHLNKCFSMGSIEVTGDVTNISSFVAETTGTIKYCYYVDTFAINKKTVTTDDLGETTENVEALEPTNTLGEAKPESELLSLDFIANTLYFDREIWFVYEGKLPVLR